MNYNSKQPVGKPTVEQVVGSGARTVDHMLVDNYGFQKYPNTNKDQIGTGPSNNPKMVDKPPEAFAEAKRQAVDYSEEG